MLMREELPKGLHTVDEALHRTRFRVLPFLGPAFIACVAYGMLIEAISGCDGARLLYAAQVAQSALRTPPGPQNPST